MENWQFIKVTKNWNDKRKNLNKKHWKKFLISIGLEAQEYD